MKVPVRLVKNVSSMNRQKIKTREQTKRSIYGKFSFEEEKTTCKDLILASYKRFTAANVILFSQHQ